MMSLQAVSTCWFPPNSHVHTHAHTHTGMRRLTPAHPRTTGVSFVQVCQMLGSQYNLPASTAVVGGMGGGWMERER